MRRVRYIYALAALMVLLTSCVKIVTPAPEDEPVQLREVELALSLDAALSKSMSLDQSDPERRVGRITIIARPDLADASKSWQRVLVYDYSASAFDDPAHIHATVRLPMGYNIIYALVNASDAMIAHVSNQNGLGLRNSRQSAYTAANAPSSPVEASDFGAASLALMSEFLPHGDAGYAMMAQCYESASGEGRIFVSPLSDAGEVVELVAELHRMVAKIRFDCLRYPGAPSFVKIDGFYDQDDSMIPEDIRVNVSPDAGSKSGWVPVSSVRYCLNSLNTKVYLEPSAGVANPDVLPEDPNFMLESALEIDRYPWNYRDGYGLDFMYCPYSDASAIFASATAPASWIAPAGGTLYCLENTAASSASLTEDELRLAPRKAATHLLVEVQFVPRYIINDIEFDTPVYLAFETMEDALAYLGDGTFWSLDQQQFYTLAGRDAAVLASGDRLSASDFTCFEKGRCYYSSYVNGGVFSRDGGSSFRRDGSYSLQSSVMKVPSLGFSLIEVSTVSRLEWDEEGSGTIEITP